LRGAVLEEEINGFLFRYLKPLRGLDYLVLGLPDVGLVGAIASLHTIREAKMEDVVGIDSFPAFPPVVVIQEGEAKHPMRLYVKDNVGVLITDVPVAPPALAPFASAIVQFARVQGVKLLVSVTGIGSPSRIEVEKPRLYALANDDVSGEWARKIGAEKIESGILVGPYALILKEATRKGLPNLVVLVESFIDLPDPEAAAVAVEAVNKITGLSVDTGKLLEEAEKIKLRLKELMRETKNIMSKMGKGMEYRPPLIFT